MSNVVLSSAPFLSPKRLPVPHGVSILDIVEFVYNDRGIPGICRLNDLITEVDGMPVSKENWSMVPPEESHVMVYMPVRSGGGGGKNPLRTLLNIAVVFAAAAIPGGLASFAAGGGLGFGAFGVGTAAFASSAIGAALISGVTMTAGMMLVNALAPIRPPSAGPAKQEYKDSATYTISGARNQMTPYGTVPMVLGTHRFFPPLAAKPYTEIIGDDEYIRLLFAWIGPCEIEDLKIGDTPIANYEGFDGTDIASNLEIRRGWATDDPITLYPSIVDQTTINTELTNAGGWVDRTVAAGYDEIAVDISFPRGLVQFDNSGNRQEQTVVVRARYREVGAPNWIYLDQTFNYLATERSMTVEPFSYGVWSVYADTSGAISFHPGTTERDSSVRLGYFTADNNGEFDTLTGVTNLTVAGRTGLVLSIDIRTGNEYVLMVSSGSVVFGISQLTVTAKTPTLIRRTVSGKFDRTKTYEIGLLRETADTDSDQIRDSVFWSNIKAITLDPPLNFPIPMAKIAMRIKASEGAQNQIDIVNCLAKSYAPIYVSGAWETVATTTTNNPAALYRQVLTHPANHKARIAAQINDSELATWYTACATNGYAFNQVRDFVSSVWDTLADVAFAGRAAPSLAYGMWGVDYDGGSRQVDAHVTPRNSWGFKAEKMLVDRPHGFRILFNNEDKDYLEDERIVYDDGYTSANATVIERLEFKGITNPDLIWKFARFHIAQARLRPETYSVLMDFENLTFKRNSLVMVSHDVPRWGDHWGRVKSLTTVSTDTTGVVLDEVVLMEALLTYACRFRLNDGSSLVVSVVNVPGETDTLVFTTPIPTATGPQVGDLAMFNESDQTAVELICTGLRRQGDMVAEVTFVDHSPAIYTADTGIIPVFNSQITGRINPLSLPAPIIDSLTGHLYAEDTVSAEIKRKIVAMVRVPATEFNLIANEIVIRTRLKNANEPWQYTRFKNSPYEISVPVDGTYEVQARYTASVKDLSGYVISESAWCVVQEVIISSVTVLGLPAPTDITGFYEMDSQGRVSKVKIRARVDLSGAVPTAVALMVSVQQTPREVTITDNGTYLTVGPVETLSSGSNIILSGSTTTNIIIATDSSPLPDLNLSGFYWGAIDSAGFRKATGSTSTAIQFADPFDNAPVPGNNLDWVEIAWADERTDEYRLLNLVSSSGTTEVVKWSTVTEVSNEYRIGGLTRAQEGTTQVVGIKAQYYPAPGAGTTTITIPASSFVPLGNNVFEGSADVMIDIPPGSWGAATFATYVLSGMRVLRSNIVPVTDWSPL